MFFHFHGYQFPEGYLQAAPTSEVYEAARNWFIKPVISILAFRYERRCWRYFKRNIARHFTLTHTQTSQKAGFLCGIQSHGCLQVVCVGKWTSLLNPQPIRCGWFGPYYQGHVYQYEFWISTLKQLRLDLKCPVPKTCQHAIINPLCLGSAYKCTYCWWKKSCTA